jgi:serine/threonine protein kinase
MSNTSPPDPADLVGRVFASERYPGVRFQLDRLVGSGGIGFAFLARREAPDGASFVVVKLMRPEFAEGEIPPELVAMKEAVALGRLNERVPPTPYVVRLVDSGTAPLFGERPTPWTAVEYVHGGLEGTTLEDRVRHSLRETGYGFDVARAAHAVRCLAAGLSAVHAVSVLHRDLTPGNVLCCGFGETEIFKIANFGVARAIGVGRSFVGLRLGTLGYAAPEAMAENAGPYTDVFSFACVVYYLLTGQRYFEVDTPKEAFDAFASSHRPSILDHATLTPELADSPPISRAIDLALARATSLPPAPRPQTAGEFAAELLSVLGQSGAPPSSSALRLSALLGAKSPEPRSGFRFELKSRGYEAIVVANAAWDADGRALAVSSRGAWFWNGQSWQDASGAFHALPQPPTFAERHDAGGWLVGNGGPALWLLDERGVVECLRAPAPEMRFALASGHAERLLAAVDVQGETPALVGISSGQWLNPCPLWGVAQVTCLKRLDAGRFLCGGRRRDGLGFAAVYSPLTASVQPLSTPELRAFVGGAAIPERGVASLIGSGGVVLRVAGIGVEASVLDEAPDLSAAATDVLGDEWVASLGSLYLRRSESGVDFDRVFYDPRLEIPFVSMMADPGYVLAMTAEGAIVEGRQNE